MFLFHSGEDTERGSQVAFVDTYASKIYVYLIGKGNKFTEKLAMRPDHLSLYKLAISHLC